MSRKLLACLAAFSVGGYAQADGLIYLTGEIVDLEELTFGDVFYVDVTGSAGGIDAAMPVQITPPQPPDGGVLFAIPNFGNPDQIVYLAFQDDPDKAEVYVLDLNEPGVATKVNAALAANQAIEAAVPSPDGARVFYTVKTEVMPGIIETVDLYVVTISNPGVATKVNPDLLDGREVGEFTITPDGAKVVYSAQLNGTAEELFVTELSNLGSATKADAAPSSTSQTIRSLSIDRDGNRAFWIGGDSQLTGNAEELLSVSLTDLGNEIVVNEELPAGGSIPGFDVSMDGTTVVYRGKNSAFEASNVYLVDLSGGTASAAEQVNPSWAGGGVGLAPSFESVSLLDSAAVAVYNGPLDALDVSEIYETPLNDLQSATKLNDELSPPAMGVPPQLGLFQTSPDEALVLYTQNDPDNSAHNVVDRSDPGNAVQPVGLGADQQPLGAAMFKLDGSLMSAVLFNLDGEGGPISGELHVADPRSGGSNVRVSGTPSEGSTVLNSIWLPPEAPTVTVTDTDGDGVGDHVDPDDDNDGVPDVDDEFPLGRFEDASPDYWAFTFVEALARAGITGGCGPSSYCPEGPVTRAQMAVFLERGIHGSDFSPPPATGDVFFDVGESDFAAAFIEQLYADGVTGGCGGGNYCPADVVNRAQMAVFLLRAKHGADYSPPPPVGEFGDVDTSYWAAAWIEQLADEGITSGCGGENYCPEALVTRAQMAVFLVRAFGL